MKTLYTLIALFVTGSAFSQITWDNFDDVRQVTYGFNIPFSEQIGNGIGGTEWPGWHGTLIQYTANPLPDAVNGSPMCVEYSRNPSELYDVIIIQPGALADLTDYVSGTKTMKMDIFSPVPGITVQITLQNSEMAAGAYPAGRHSEYTAVTSTGAQWETLEFEFVQQPDPSVENTNVDELVILFNPGNQIAETYYFDNFMGPELVEINCEEFGTDVWAINDFDCNQGKFVIEYADGRLSRINNPDQSGVNDSPNCLEYARNGGAQDDVIVGNFNGAIDLSQSTDINIDLYDYAAPSSFVFSIQDGFGTELAQTTLTTTTSEVWESFTMSFPSIAGAPNAEKFVILYEPGLLVAESILIDNIRQDVIIGIDEVGNQNLVLSPNPASNSVGISWDGGPAMVRIFSVSGQVVHEEYMTPRERVDVSALTSGMYHVVIQNGDSSLTKTLVIAE